MRALYEIEKEILDCVDLETGEILDPEKLDALEMEREKKIEAVILWYKDIKAEKEAVKAEGKKFYERAASLQRKEDQLKEYVENALGGEKFKTERCSVSYRTSKSIKIDDLKAIPKRFLKEISEEWISKTMIKEVIESGKKVKGAHQEEKMGIVIK